jgi:hypothetical protein
MAKRKPKRTPDLDAPAADPTDEAIIGKARQEAQEKIAAMQKTADFITAGLSFLKKKANPYFNYYEMTAGAPDNIAMGATTKIAIKDAPEENKPEDDDAEYDDEDEQDEPAAEKGPSYTISRQDILINADGDVFTNRPEADQPPEEYAIADNGASDDDLADASFETVAIVAASAAIRNRRDADSPARDEHSYLCQAFNYNADIEKTDPHTALADIARNAVLQNLAPPLTNPRSGKKGATPAQEAVLDGLRRGTLQYEAEMMHVLGAAKPFLHGLAFLQNQANGRLDVRTTISPHRQEIEIEIRPFGSFGEEQFASKFVKITANGLLQHSNDRLQNYTSLIYDVMEGKHLKLLRALAKSAVFSEIISELTPDAKEKAVNAEQKAVLEALRQARIEKAVARETATHIKSALDALERDLGDNFAYDTLIYSGSSNVAIEINPETPWPMNLIADCNGFIGGCEEKYFVSDPARREALVAKITRHATFVAKKLEDAKKGATPALSKSQAGARPALQPNGF